MLIEAFSEGKNLDAPEACEDAFLVLPGLGYAVIDGVTDRTGHRYDGMLAGKVAGLAVQRAVAALLLERDAAAMPVQLLVQRLSAAIQEAYARHGILEEAHRHAARRFGATLALAMHHGAGFRFVLIGDSGLRLDGREVWINDSGLDLVTTSLRQEAYRQVAAAGGGPEDCARVGRACAFEGAARLRPEMRPWLDEAALSRLRAACLASCRSRFPKVPEADLAALLDGGIVHGQGKFQNNTKSPLSYAVLDGFAVPTELVKVIDRPAVRSIELFTDGWFAIPAEPSLAAWQATFAEVERTDPLKLDRYPSVKGTQGRIRADDRTVVIVTP